MKKRADQQKCELMQAPSVLADSKLKYLTVMVFEEAGKTVLQPVTTSQEAQSLQDLFQNKSLEVWISNGQPDPAQFDVSILKYKQTLQPPKMCSKAKSRVCLKNHFETIVTCEQCPLNDYGDDK